MMKYLDRALLVLQIIAALALIAVIAWGQLYELPRFKDCIAHSGEPGYPQHVRDCW